MPTMTSQMSPRPWPSARWLAKNPATRPTSAQTRTWSRSKVTGVPLREITIAVRGPLYKRRYGALNKRRGGLGHLFREFVERHAEDAVEGVVGVDHVGQRLDR